ncbi:MAG: sigma-54-dependent Fis family transcriptional regulator [Saprospiraceae bacterium]|nr:sigma-54-dependent Fis family transcriptional regulator [Saprospiraceae bacterium]
MANPTLQNIKLRFGIIGASPLLDAALGTASRVAPTELTALIQGESGVGKEAFSKIIHALSARKHNQFIAINCGAIPEGTINSELFGHEKGAFTGAVNERKGYFETVNGGTIFLDEIGEMPLDTQALLLRVLENGEFVRVGASKVEKTDVRVIAATNVNLEEAVRKGKFREDLFYRLSTVPIKVPSLKERSEDIYMLFRKFASDFAEKYRTTPIQLDDRARLVLERYTFPGNIRELKNITEQLSVLSEEKLIKGEDLLENMPHLLSRPLPVASRNGSKESNFEEREIMYKLLFDMKNDLNYLKTVIAELIKNNNLTVPNTLNINALALPASRDYNNNYPSVSNDFSASQRPFFEENFADSSVDDRHIEIERNTNNYAKPIIITNPSAANFDQEVEVVEESLNMADTEKRLIIRALKNTTGGATKLQKI